MVSILILNDYTCQLSLKYCESLCNHLPNFTQLLLNNPNFVFRYLHCLNHLSVEIILEFYSILKSLIIKHFLHIFLQFPSYYHYFVYYCLKNLLLSLIPKIKNLLLHCCLSFWYKFHQSHFYYIKFFQIR